MGTRQLVMWERRPRDCTTLVPPDRVVMSAGMPQQVNLFHQALY